MKAVAVLFVLSCAIAATYAQGSDFMTMMLLRNMLSGGGGSSGGAASQPAGVSAVGGSGMGQGYPAIGQSANRGGGGSNPLFQMSLLTGGLGGMRLF